MMLQCPEFKYITEERLLEWKSPSPSALPVVEPVPLDHFLYELVWAMVQGDLPPHKCQVALEWASNHEAGEGWPAKGEIESQLADIIAHLQDLLISGEHRLRLVKVAKSLVELGLLAPQLLQERCEEEFLWEAELSRAKAQDLKTKEVRVNTRLLYQQTKFNLLREESEGYAKLVTLLCQGGLSSYSQTSSVVTVSIIKSLIGHFDLDPNRVFEIVLEFAELYPENMVFHHLISIFPKSHVAHVLGFKFQYYQRAEVDVPAPPSVFRLAASLVKDGFVDLDTLYAHLIPTDEEAFEHRDAVLSKRIDEAAKIGKINLAAIGKDLIDEEKHEMTFDLYASLDMEKVAITEQAADTEKNQKLGLLLGFLSVGDWDHARLLFDRLARLNPVEHPKICNGLFRMIEKTMSPAYDIARQMCYRAGQMFDQGVREATPESLPCSPVDIPRHFFQMLAVVGPYLHRDTELLQKVCRVLKAYYLVTKETPPTSRIEEALGLCLLPSLQLIPANPAICFEIWGVLSLLPYEVRYRLYGEWDKDDERNPVVLSARQIAKLDTRRILKRLAKENLKQLGRMIAKLAHANPMTVLRTIVQQIEAYKDMISPVVDAFKYLTQLEYDVLQYIVIERLAQVGRQKLKDDGLNLSDWLQSLASFWGHLCKKHPLMDLKSLFQYLVNRLKKGSGIELVILEELIQQMANVQYTENITDEQIEAMAGSETLRQQATVFGITRNSKVLGKSTNKLRDSLLPREEPKLAIPLLLLIAQHRSVIVISAEAPHIKMVSEQYDRCHGVLLQYAEFLSSVVSPVTYSQMIPPLGDLIHKYHIEPEVAFLVYRPVMRQFQSIGGNHWPLEDIEDLNANHDMESTSPAEAFFHLDSAEKSVTWQDFMNVVQSILPSKAWNSLSPELYATFWGLTLYDLQIPKARYESEVSKQHSALRNLEENGDNSSIAITKRKKEKERIQDILDKLISECQRHEQHVASVSRRLNREKDKWLCSISDALKINMEFLQRCILPRCVFSMQDAVYCALFVEKLHSLGTPFFNTVNHIDVLICKTLQPMICSCTEFEAGRFGRFLYETLRTAFYWKSSETIYERECGNMPGFAVYIRYPNSQRVTYSQFIRVHWKWSSRITKVLNQCLESEEYMEVRNALVVLTKISSIFPVIRRSGLNLEKRIAKIKVGDREDLKVLATGVAAALAARKSSWVSEEEFGMGHINLKPKASPGKSIAGNQLIDSTSTPKEQLVRSKSSDSKLDIVQQKRNSATVNISESHPLPAAAQVKTLGVSSIADVLEKVVTDEALVKLSPKPQADSETKPLQRRMAQNPSTKASKQDVSKEDGKSGKVVNRNVNQQSAISADREVSSLPSETLQETNIVSSAAAGNNNANASSGKVSGSSQRAAALTTANMPKLDGGATNLPGNAMDQPDSAPRQQKRTSPTDDQEKTSKRRKGDADSKDGERLPETWPTDKFHSADRERHAGEEQRKDRSDDRHEKEQKEKSDRGDKTRGEDSVDRRERSTDRSLDKVRDEQLKDEKSRSKHEALVDRAHTEERFRGQSLPPPPPLPTSFVPQSVGSNRRDEESDRKVGRHVQRLSPRLDEKDKRYPEEGVDDGKRRKEDDFRDRKREERDASSSKFDDSDAGVAPKRRKNRRDQLSTLEPGEFAPNIPLNIPGVGSSQIYDARERTDRKGAMMQHRGSYADDISRSHAKESASSKIHRREEVELIHERRMHERDWEEEKRQRTESKRKHRK